jgi:RNA polymerase subunit RPABC4/transcription elongation factor Spt4
MSELESKFNAMIFGFTINSVSDPVVSDDTIVIVSFIVVIAAAMMIAILLVARGKKCPRCGAWTKRGSAWCAKCGSPLGQNMVNFCGQCGSMLGAEGTCPSCGANKAAEKPKQ